MMQQFDFKIQHFLLIFVANIIKLLFLFIDMAAVFFCSFVTYQILVLKTFFVPVLYK